MAVTVPAMAYAFDAKATELHHFLITDTHTLEARTLEIQSAVTATHDIK